MNKQDVIDKIQASRIIAVIRTPSANLATDVAEALLEGGINCLEITLTIPDAQGVISGLAKRFGNEVLVGAGTVLDAVMAKACIDAGAKFIVSPYLSIETIELCNKAETAVFAGALTPTEIFTAWNAGADCVKVFPAGNIGGASYLRAIKSPFPDIKLIPTGGVNIDNISDYFAAGAFAVGAGGELGDGKILMSQSKAALVNLAEKYGKKAQP